MDAGSKGCCYDRNRTNLECYERKVIAMETRILVAYASTHGSTREIAMKVAEILRGHGLMVGVEQIGKVRTLDGYTGVLLGAPLYMFKWNRDAVHFLSRFKNTIQAGFPVAVFMGGPTDEENGGWDEIRRQVKQELGKFPWFNPVSLEIVGGRFDPTSLRFPYNLIPAMRQMPATDLRDWDAIRRWADNLAEMMGSTISRSQTMQA
jgi:menaquinone-dependent protoporphyrinogen oxidase